MTKYNARREDASEGGDFNKGLMGGWTVIILRMQKLIYKVVIVFTDDE